MKLFEIMMEPCVFMEKHRESDGMGGLITVWTEGAEFNAAIGKDSTTAGRLAEKEGVTEIYTVTVYKGTPIAPFDVFKRVRDGKIFRATSDIRDNETPPPATFQIGQVSAEAYRLNE